MNLNILQDVAKTAAAAADDQGCPGSRIPCPGIPDPGRFSGIFVPSRNPGFLAGIPGFIFSINIVKNQFILQIFCYKIDFDLLKRYAYENFCLCH